MTADHILDLPAWASTPVAIAAGVLMLFFGCRVRLLTPREHRAPVWLVHWAGMLVCGWTAILAASGGPLHAVDVAILAMAGAHIWGTYYSWAWGVPDHAVRAKPAPGADPVPDGILARVVGGRGADDRGRQ